MNGTERVRLGVVLLGLSLCACSREERGPAAPAPAAPASAWPVSAARGESRPPAYERVVLVTIDTLRADHVSCYGYRRRTTPFLDSLAARGVRFARGMAAVSHTAPSHATMLTGLVPAVHGVLENGGRLDPAALAVPTLFRQAGFETAAFLNVLFLSGVAAAFESVQVLEAGGREPHSGAAVVDAALAWLTRARKTERFFLWVHLYDPHAWPPRFFARTGHDPTWSGDTPAGFFEYLAELHGLPAPAAGQPYAIPWGTGEQSEPSPKTTGAAIFEAAIERYDVLTLFADEQVQRLYAGLEALALSGRTLWIVTSDHGEGLASHATTGHGARIYQEQLHVPLVLHASDDSLAARVVDELVAHVDLLPTLAETLGFRVSGHAPAYTGRSLWPLVRGEAWEPRAVFSQRRPIHASEEPERAELYALQSARHKLIRHIPGTDEFFDLEQDPGERINLGASHRDAAELRAALDEVLRQHQRLKPASAGQDVPPEWAQELRGLGY